MNIQTITTIELSSLCNLSCVYCINRMLVKHPARKAGIMSDAVFDRSLELLAELVRRGTQKELNLNGNGESLLDPQLLKRIKHIRELVGNKIKVQMSTNAVLLTQDMARNLAETGIDCVHLSPHKPEYVRKAVCHMMTSGLKGAINFGPMFPSHNWAGQLEPENRVIIEPMGVSCEPVEQGRAYIQSEGDVVPCCYDYRNLGRIGHVFDVDILEREVKHFVLCKTCHQYNENKENHNPSQPDSRRQDGQLGSDPPLPC